MSGITNFTLATLPSAFFTEARSFVFDATIGKNNKVTMTFSGGTTGSATGILDLTQMTLKGVFSAKNSDGTFAGTFSVKKA